MTGPVERCFVRKQMRLEDVKYSDANSVYFATLCARHRITMFDDRSLADAVVDSLMWRREHGLIKLYAYCLMPDHLHLAAAPGPATSLSDEIGKFKSYTTARARDLGYQGQLWQRSWYDHVARRDEDVLGICRYILENPVRKGLVATVDEWPYEGLLDPVPF